MKRLVFGLTLPLLAATAVWSQSLTGSISGTVKDEQGGAVPGAMVTLSGKTGRVGATTDAKGFYRFPTVDPGSYEIQVEMSGFQARRETGVTISVGKHLTLDFPLKVASVAEAVEVLGEAPGVDVTSSASANSISQDMLFHMPLSRFSFNLLNYAPGVNNDSGYGGGNDSGNSLLLDGVDTRSPGGGGAYIYMNYNIVEEVQIQGLGAPAEYGGFTGAVINTITRSGGNAWSGLFDVQYTAKGLSSDNVPASARLANPTLDVPLRTNKLLDATAQVGGPILKDKLFFFLSFQRYELDYEPPGPRTKATEVTPRLYAKLTYQPGPNDYVMGLLQAEDYNRTNRPNSYAGSFATTDGLALNEDSKDRLWSVQWRHLFGPKTFAEVKYLGWTAYDYYDPKVDQPLHYEYSSGEYFGGGGYHSYFDRKRHQVNASISHYAEAFGKHDLKFGVEVERGRVRDRFGYTGGLYFYDYYGPYQAYSYSYDQLGDNHRESVYAQDSWKAGNRLTINAGVRFDSNRGLEATSGKKVFDTKSLAPRLGIAWDLFGDHSTVLKAAYSRYYEGMFETYFYRVLPGLADTVIYDVTGPEPVEIDRVHNVSAYRIDPNIEHPRTDEFILGFERALTKDVRLAATGIIRNGKDFISSVNPSATWSPTTVANELTGQPLTVYNWANQDESGSDFLITNPHGFQYRDPSRAVIGTADAETRYRALMVVLTKRMTNRWQAQLSYVLSKNTGALDPNTVENIGYGRQFENPNRSLVNADGEFQTSRRHELKVFATYEIPKVELGLNAYLRAISGTTYTPYARYSSSEIDYPLASGREPWLEPLGSRRLATEAILDLRVEKIFKLGGGKDRVAVYADVTNVFNKALVDGVVSRVPSSNINGYDVPFGSATSIIAPRQITFGGRWSF